MILIDKNMDIKDEPTFQISSAHQSFAEKQKNLFDQLNNVAKTTNLHKTSNDEYMESDDKCEPDRKSLRSATKQFKRKESMFKTPQAPISKCLPIGRVPGFRKNPTNYTKYTLADVKDEDISDRANTSAALSFLKELENRKSGEEEQKLEVLPSKITFKKTAIVKKIVNNDDEDDNKVSFSSSKLIMPEYVVGQKIKKDKKNREKRSANNSKQLKLDHLLNDDED